MNKLINMFWIWVFGIVFIGRIGAQLPEFHYAKKEGLPAFYYDIINLAAEESGKTLLRVYSKIVYDELQFVREEDQYRAEYELTVTVFDHQGGQVEGKILKKGIVVESFEKTNSRTEFILAEVEFTLIPDKYELLIGILDFDTKKTGYQKRKIVVPDYHTNSFDVSDILLADSVFTDSSGSRFYFPNVIGNYGDTQESLYLCFEIYSRVSSDSVKVIYRILDMKMNVLREQEYYKTLDGAKTLEVMEIPRKELKSGQYRLELVVEKNGSIEERSRDFTIRWFDMPESAPDLDAAIEQLRYIADGNKIQEMRKAEEKKKKEELFRKFWREKDPTPGTDINELMDEYYRRVQVAVENFGTYEKGWKTDRGMVYIILGPPNEIERHPFEAGSKPYEIWSYYNINRELVFVDYTGFGEYRLTNRSWEVLNQIR